MISAASLIRTLRIMPAHGWILIATVLEAGVRMFFRHPCVTLDPLPLMLKEGLRPARGLCMEDEPDVLSVGAQADIRVEEAVASLLILEGALTAAGHCIESVEETKNRSIT